jgi:hypothetical protein
MKIYKVPVVYQMCGFVEVMAESVTEAVLVALEAPLPDDPAYVEGTFEVVDTDMICEVK